MFCSVRNSNRSSHKADRITTSKCALRLHHVNSVLEFSVQTPNLVLAESQFPGVSKFERSQRQWLQLQAFQPSSGFRYEQCYRQLLLKTPVQINTPKTPF